MDFNTLYDSAKAKVRAPLIHRDADILNYAQWAVRVEGGAVGDRVAVERGLRALAEDMAGLPLNDAEQRDHEELQELLALVAASDQAAWLGFITHLRTRLARLPQVHVVNHWPRMTTGVPIEQVAAAPTVQSAQGPDDFMVRRPPKLKDEQGVTHGTAYRYNQKCRCELCCAARLWTTVRDFRERHAPCKKPKEQDKCEELSDGSRGGSLVTTPDSGKVNDLSSSQSSTPPKRGASTV